MTDTYVVGATGKATIIKDPVAALDYSFDWSLWLADIVDTIASHQIIVPTGLTLDSSNVAGGKVIAWLSGGTEGQTYKVDCRITTASTPPRTDSRSIYVKIKDR